MPPERKTSRADGAVRRLCRILSTVRLDCRCRETLSAELDEIFEFETDRTVFEELALVFDEIGMAASETAKEIRSTERPLNLETYTDNIQQFDTAR